MAAGLGTRFGEQTELKPKGFIPFKGIPMVERSIQTLITRNIMKPLLINTLVSSAFSALALLKPIVCTLYGIVAK